MNGLRAEHPNRLTALDLVARLLDAGADPNKPFSGQMDSASMCCDTQGSGTPFFRAAVAADVDSLKLLVAHGADLEWRLPRVEGVPPPFGDKTGVFREPGSRDPAEAVRLLLQAGANPNALSPAGDSALHIAAPDGRLGPMRELVAGGADVTLRNKKGQTALEMVEKMGPRKMNELAAMLGLFDDGAQPKETAAVLRELIASRAGAAAAAKH